MLRRQARERRDYLYRRALTLRDAEIAEKRAKLKISLATGKPLDPSIANDKKLRQDYKYDETRADRTTEEEDRGAQPPRITGQAPLTSYLQTPPTVL